MEKESSITIRGSAVVWDTRSGRDYSLERAGLAAHGIEFRTPAMAERREAIASADVVLVHIEPFTAADIAGMVRGRGIVSYGIGTDSIDVDAANAAGLAVRNVPGYCTDEVADHAMSLLLLGARRLDVARYRSAAEWADAKRIPPLRRLRGRCVGIIGMGRIGQAIAERCAGFGLDVIGYDPHPRPGADLARLVTLDELAERAHIVVAACELTPATAGLVGSDLLAKLGPEAVVVNISRGGVVDEAALASALNGGRLAFAALDVRGVEPPDAGADPLEGCPNLYLTPHVAASSIEAVRDLNQGVVSAVVELMDGGR